MMPTRRNSSAKAASVENALKSRASELVFALTKSIASILVPLGLGFGDFVSVAKTAFVAAADLHIRRRGKRSSTARIAILTGLTRAEVARIRAGTTASPRASSEQRTERVMHGWFTDPRYVDELGDPRALPILGTGSFDELVKRYSGDVPRKAVLDELIAGGMASADPRGQVRAVRRHHVAANSSHLDIERLTKDVEIIFESAESAGRGDAGCLRRITVKFAGRIPASVRRTINIRSERFLEALADYLHSEAESSDLASERASPDGASISILIAHCESNESK